MDRALHCCLLNRFERTHNQHPSDANAPPRHTTNSPRSTNGMLAKHNAILTCTRHTTNKNGRSPGRSQTRRRCSNASRNKCQSDPHYSRSPQFVFFLQFPGGVTQAPAEWRRTTASTPVPRTKHGGQSAAPRGTRTSRPPDFFFGSDFKMNCT